jgi:8-oxo-dGTP diphosphatase
MTDDFLPLAAAVVRKDGKVLIARRRRAFMGYLWEFPGGEPKEEETLQEGLRRALKEDLGIDVAVGDYISSSGHVINCQLSIRFYAYETTHVAGEFALEKYEEVRWAAPAELRDFDFAEPGRSLARTLMAVR